ncbi:MAG: hydroxymethylglutaryl-CoA lyase [Pseudomonadota bacterium]
MADTVRLVEVGPRDGLQNEKQTIEPATKIELIDRLSLCGLSVIEAGAFVSPKWVPQMAASDTVFRGIAKRSGVTYPVLVPNMRGFETALGVGVREIAIFTAASETFSRKNTNATIDETFARFAPLTRAATDNDIKVRGYVSCVLGCPFEGEIDADTVAQVAGRLFDLGCYEISLGDTIGVGTFGGVRRLLSRVTQAVPAAHLAGHFHDTYGQALANIHAALDAGLRVFDSSVAGLGGCPYAPGATGNVATEDCVYMLEKSGLTTGVDLDALMRVSRWISQTLHRTPQSRVTRAHAARMAS